MIESLPIAGRIVPSRMEREDAPLPPVVSLRDGAVVVTFRLPKETTGKTPQVTLQVTPQKLPEAILHLVRGQPELSSAQIALQLGKSESAVKRAIRKLRESGRLTRIGPDKGGHWKVNE